VSRRIEWRLRFGSVLVACTMVVPVAAQESARTEPPTGPSTSGPNACTSSDSFLVCSPLDLFGLVFDQIGQPAPPPPTPAHTGIKAMIKAMGRDIVNLPSRQNLVWVGVGAGLTAAAHPLDNKTNATLAGPTLNKVFASGAVMGESYTLLPIAAAVYAFGRIEDQPKVSHMGSDLIQSLAIAELLTQSLKYSVRRERPDGSGPNSFPSGHAADTMAFATALERHFDWRLWLPAYTFASYVAISRLHDNVHYLSDVMAGSAVGIIAGRTVTRHGRTNFPVEAMAVPGGMAIIYVRQGS
jgi:membrane-associated phospholipid phosphatase